MERRQIWNAKMVDNMENEQTAVEWLIDKLLDGKLLMPSLIEQADAMEKKQMAEKYDEGHGDGYHQALKDLEMHNMIK
jgi:hypothetical protein